MVYRKTNGKVKFRVWAPLKKTISLHLLQPKDQRIEMKRVDDGYWEAEVDASDAAILYYLNPDNEGDLPDPGSEYQPQGVKGPSQIIDHSSFHWTDAAWKSQPLRSWVIYEIHVGCFTAEGTFDAIIPRLPELKSIGINAIELMPVNQFPGDRNWGYDGAYPYAVQNTYGGPAGLKRLVDACHANGIAVVLDVIYNHLGPEGNYFAHFGPYFTDKYKTPWGSAINFDDKWCDGVRNFFADNVLYWFEHFHVDALRCDAVHMMFDNSAMHFWAQTMLRVRDLQERLGRNLYMIAESDLNSPMVTQPVEQGGWGFDAQWLDDFHHALYAALDESGKKRYYDFGSLGQVKKSVNEGFVHSGQWVEFRKKLHGISSAGVPGDQFVAFINNHDQAGNRPGGERLNMLVDFNRAKLAAAVLLLSPYIPFLFMGEEYGEDSPFFFFADYSEEELRKGVAEGRKKEFEDFPSDQEAPDALSEETYQQSKIQWEKRNSAGYREMLNWYSELLGFRASNLCMQEFDKQYTSSEIVHDAVLLIRRRNSVNVEEVFVACNLSDREVSIQFPEDIQHAKLLLSSDEPRFQNNKTHFNQIHPEKPVRNETILLGPASVVIYLASPDH